MSDTPIIHWKWCLSRLERFILPGGAKHKDLRSACNATTWPLQANLLKSHRKIQVPFCQSTTEANHYRFCQRANKIARTCEFTNEQLSILNVKH